MQQWLDQITQRPQLWCDELQAFLGLAPVPSLVDDEASEGRTGAGGGTSGGGAGAGAGGGGGASSSGASAVAPPPTAEMAELEWIASRMGSAQGGVQRSGSGSGSGGVARGDNIVRWLLAQALAGSREQAVTLAEAMRKAGLLQPTSAKKADAKFADSSSATYRLALPGDAARQTAPP